MKILLAAVNAKYIHSNLGIYSLKAYGEKMLAQWGYGKENVQIGLAEYTINHQLERILQDIYLRQPDVIGFSCYIWNISYIKALVADLKKVLPQVKIWLGGPEVSYCAEDILQEEPGADLVMKGEGEETFAQFLRFLAENEIEKPAYGGLEKKTEAAEKNRWTKGLEHIPGLVFRRQKSQSMEGETPDLPRVLLSAAASKALLHDTIDTGVRPVMDMNRIPFPYAFLDMEQLAHRIIYYESSRGCPFSCAYCLSSIDKSVRLRSLELVKEELSFFLKAKVPQVKFVDRTFNCQKSHAMAIWQFIRENDNGVTNFHFEIAADLLDCEELKLLSTMRPGLIQLEIGVQSTNPSTLAAIRRKTDIEKIRAVTQEINSWNNIHQHLDLIAGLPKEDLESFKNSFNEVYSMKPEQLQLGFLKVLAGSYMEEMVPSCGLLYASAPPYEVFSTRWLSYRDILELKEIEEMVEIYYNSRQFTTVLAMLEREFSSSYEMFLALAAFYRKKGYFGMNHSRLARYEILWEMAAEELFLETDSSAAEYRRDQFRDCLMTDLYLRENIKSRPSFARDLNRYRDEIRSFFKGEETTGRYLPDHQGCDSRQLAKMAHLEPMGDGTFLLFDYKNRDPLTYNARAVEIGDICKEHRYKKCQRSKI
ncbi:MAG: B12-binding domain-containing radical SAM protein [Clostridiales bacterium]|nr:B12-binding domain-containing radical SAM protein [Clostridiales bacterium]